MAETTTNNNPFEPPKASLETSGTEPAPPLWNPNAAGLWSLLFSTLFGSILVRLNWKALDQPAKVSTGTLWIGISVLMLFVSVFFPPVGFLYLIVWYFAWQKPQAKYIRERWGSDYPRRGWLIPIVLGIVGWFVFAVTLWALIYLLVLITR